MVSDVRYALTWLVRSPGFAAVAILSLAMGIRFNTALFSIVDALLFRPLPVSRPDRLVDVYTRGGDGDRYATSSYPITSTSSPGTPCSVPWLATARRSGR